MSVSSSGGGLAEIERALKQLLKKQVLVGIPEGDGARQAAPDGAEEQPTNAELGYLHHFGKPSENIPARPWLLPAITGAQTKISGHLKKAAESALDGDMSKADRHLHAAGMTAQNAAKAKLTNGPFRPLSKQRMQERLAKGQANPKPLLDTMQMRNSVIYIVKDLDDN